MDPFCQPLVIAPEGGLSFFFFFVHIVAEKCPREEVNRALRIFLIPNSDFTYSFSIPSFQLYEIIDLRI